jgi:hypothetical protein
LATEYIIEGEVADGDFISPPMDGSYWSMLLSSIRFFSQKDMKEQVVPSGGNITVMLSIDNINYFSIPAGEFLAIDSYNPDRMMPNAYGTALYCKINLSGITGATYFKATISRTV